MYFIRCIGLKITRDMAVFDFNVPNKAVQSGIFVSLTCYGSGGYHGRVATDRVTKTSGSPLTLAITLASPLQIDDVTKRKKRRSSRPEKV